MAEIVNLRRARKGKARAEKDARAADNRVRFGRTKAERAVRAWPQKSDKPATP